MKNSIAECLKKYHEALKEDLDKNEFENGVFDNSYVNYLNIYKTLKSVTQVAFDTDDKLAMNCNARQLVNEIFLSLEKLYRHPSQQNLQYANRIYPILNYFYSALIGAGDTKTLQYIFDRLMSHRQAMIKNGISENNLGFTVAAMTEPNDLLIMLRKSRVLEIMQFTYLLHVKLFEAKIIKLHGIEDYVMGIKSDYEKQSKGIKFDEDSPYRNNIEAYNKDHTGLDYKLINNMIESYNQLAQSEGKKGFFTSNNMIEPISLRTTMGKVFGPGSDNL